MKRKSIIINRFDYRNSIASVYNKLKSCSYSDDTGYGFKSVEKDNNVLFATIIKRTPTFINYFKSGEAIFEKQQIFIYSEFPIFIDFQFKALYIIGPSVLLSFVKSILKTILGDDLIINSLEFSAYDLYDIIKKKKIKNQIEEIVINNFLYENGIIGRFSGKVTNAQIAASILRQYKLDIFKITFRVNNHEEDFVIQLANNGAVAISGEEEDFRENLFYLIKLILE